MRAVYDLVELAPVIAASRQLAFADQTLEQYLPAIAVADVDYRLGRADRVDQTVPPRALDTPAPLIARGGAVEVRGGLPAFSAMDLLTETDLIRARRLAGLPIDLRLDVAAAAGRTTGTVLNSMEVLRGQALFTGVISLNANGVNQSVDFGLPPGNKLVAPTPFTTLTADALGQLQAYADAYVASAGGPPGVMLTSTRVLRLLLRNSGIIAAIAGTNTGRTQVTRNELNNLLAAEGLPPVQTYDRSLRGLDGTLTRITPDDRIALLPGEGTRVGQTQYGITEEAVELVGQRILAAEAAPGMAVVTLVEDNPVQRAVLTAAIGMPVIQDPNLILVAKVA